MIENITKFITTNHITQRCLLISCMNEYWLIILACSVWIGIKYRVYRQSWLTYESYLLTPVILSFFRLRHALVYSNHGNTSTSDQVRCNPKILSRFCLISWGWISRFSWYSRTSELLLLHSNFKRFCDSFGYWLSTVTHYLPLKEI